MTDDEIQAKAKANVQAVLEHCRKLTLQLTELSSETKRVKGVASGFFIRLNGAIYLVSAGHVLETNGWAIETDFTIEGENLTVCIPIGGAWTLKKITAGNREMQDLDVAWAKVNLEDFQKAVSENTKLRGKSFEYLIYEGTLEDLPDAKEPHIYAAANRADLIFENGKTYLKRDFSYEYEMEYKGIDEEGLYVFSVPNYKGNDHYEGASGSPIIEPSGKVVAIFVAGCESKSELYGYPTRGLGQLIMAGADSEQDRTGPGTA
jgi:hypothetical protein